MADRHAVPIAGAGWNWDATASTKWSLTNGGAGGQTIPDATTPVFFDSGSNAFVYTVSQNGRLALDLTFTGFTGTFAGGNTLSIAGNLIIAAGMTWTYNGGITFTATTTGKTITSNGKAIAAGLTFNGVGGGWTLADALNTTGQITVTNGALTDAGFTLTAGTISSSNSNTRSITKTGNWNISGTGANILLFSTVTGLTFSDTAGAVNLTNATSGDRTVNFGNLTWNDLKVSAGAGNLTVSALNGAGSVRDVDFTGFTGAHSAGTINFRRNLTYDAGMTGTTAGAAVYVGTSGTGTLTNNGITRTGAIVVNGVGGTLQLADNLSLSTVGVTLTNGSFVDAGKTITMSAWSSNNSNARTLTKTGNWTIAGTGNVFVNNTTDNMTVTDSGSVTFTDSSAVARTANFGSVGTNPIAWGDVKVNAGTGDFTLVASVASVNHVDFTGYTGALQTANVRFRNDWKYGAGMTDIGTSAMTYIGTSGTCSFTSNGVVMSRNLQVAGAGGTVRLLDALNINSAHVISHTDGTFNYNDQNATLGAHQIAPNTPCTVSLGSGTITLTQTTGGWSANSASITLNKGTATLKFTDKGPTTKTLLAFAGQTYPTVWNDTQGVSSVLILSGSGVSISYDVVKSSPGATFQIGSTTTQTAGDWQCSGTAGNLVTFQSGTPGAQYTMAKSGGGLVDLDYISVSDSIASPANTFRAGLNSVDGGNNTGWLFQRSATLSTTDENDTCAETALDGRLAVLTTTDDNDICVETALMSRLAVLSTIDQNDTCVESATLAVAATLNTTDQNDICVETDTLGRLATLSTTDDDDACVFAATIQALDAVALVRYLLTQNADVTAIVPAARIQAGVLPLKTQMPAIGVTTISALERTTVDMIAQRRFITERVQVTVLTKDYPGKKTVLRAVARALPISRGTINGTVCDCILPDVVGPDLDDPESGIYSQSRDFIVRWYQ